MKLRLMTALSCVSFLCAMPLLAAEIDWKKVDGVMAKTPVVTGNVHRYGIPRSDLKVMLDGVDIKPGLALGGWVAFEQMGDKAMAMSS
jgi:hypothetical protein